MSKPLISHIFGRFEWGPETLRLFCSTCRMIMRLRAFDFPESREHIKNLKHVNAMRRKFFTTL